MLLVEPPMRSSRATLATTDAAAADAQSRSAFTTADRKPDTASGRDVVVVAVEEDDRLLGDDTRRTEISDRTEGGESEGADDPRRRSRR
jgi:hypothetical protein